MTTKEIKAYCENCNEKVGYLIIKEVKEEYRGVKVNVKQHIGVCLQCKERLYIDELEEVNLDRLYTKYRELTGMMYPKDIIEFRAKYNISKRELEEILDWGEINIICRYERGSLPNQSHNEILKLIINNENYFREKVKDAYKAGRITEKTYTKILCI